MSLGVFLGIFFTRLYLMSAMHSGITYVLLSFSLLPLGFAFGHLKKFGNLKNEYHIKQYEERRNISYSSQGKQNNWRCHHII